LDRTISEETTMRNFTFKKQKRATGLAAVCEPWPNTTIKLGSRSTQWRVMLCLKDEQQTCGWRWAQLKGRWDSEQEARQWLKELGPELQQKFELHKLDFDPE
jgi:hypothetical protein